MIYKTYIEKSDLKKEILFNGKIKNLGWILKTHKDYFNKPPNFLLGINSSSKIIKGKKLNIHTGVLYLASHTMVASKTLCPNAIRNGCHVDCLVSSGMLGMKAQQIAMISRTLYYLNFKKEFMAQLRLEINKGYKKYGNSFAVRLNGTSDINWKDIVNEFPNVQFYDYTKNKNMMIKNKNKNHHYTFSGSMFSDYSRGQLKQAINEGLNIAIAFNTKESKKDTLKIPKQLFNNKPLVSFDDTDVRFKDKRGSVGYLKRKGSNIQQRLNDNKQFNNFFVTESNINYLTD
jgi:hypothetical protein